MTVEFKADTHQYFREGLELPSVTTILQELGFVDTRWFKPADSEKGTAIHKMMQLYEEDDLDWGTVEYPEYLEGWIDFKKENEVVMEYTEKIVYHPTWMYAGTVDWIGYIGDRPAIIDFKSGQSLKWHKAQLCMYAATGNAENPILATFLLKTGKIKYYDYDKELVDAICKTYKFKTA